MPAALSRLKFRIREVLTRLTETGADAFTIMRIAGHGSVVISQRYVHTSPEAIERASERLKPLLEGNWP